MTGRVAQGLRSLRLATALTAIVAAAAGIAAGGGCLWAPDIHEAPKGNEATGPVIDRGKVTPSADKVEPMSTTMTFTVASAISDATTAVESLAFYWFINYRTNGLPAYTTGNGASAKSLTINPCAAKFKDVYGVQAGQRTEVELIVLDPAQATYLYDPDAGRVIAGPYAYVLWTLDVQAKCP